MGIVLVLGGTKTGKTSFAENRAISASEEKNLPVYYIATARAIDNEMADRIKKHRERRPAYWNTIEEPLCVSSILRRLGGEECVILLDCLTLLMTNLIFEMGDECSREKAEEAVFEELDRIIHGAAEIKTEIIIISNQVENGLVSEHQWARMFQDIAGIAHQKMASAADHVYMMNAGLALKLK